MLIFERPKIFDVDVAVPAGMLLVFAATYVIVLAPAYRALQSMPEGDAAYRAIKARQTLVRQQHNAAVEHRERIKKEIEAIGGDLPHPRNIDRFIRSITNLADAAGFRVDAVNLEVPQDRHLFQQIPVTMMGASSFADFYMFLKALTAQGKFIQVRAFSIAKDQAGTDNKCNASLTLYLFTGPKGQGPVQTAHTDGENVG